MILIKFKNIRRSEIIQQVVNDRIEGLVEKFEDLQSSRLKVTLEMKNSPTQAGPDLFSVKLHVIRGRYDGITIEKSEPNLYVALAEVIDHMLEVLNRFGDKVRVKERAKARRIKQYLEQVDEENQPEKIVI